MKGQMNLFPEEYIKDSDCTKDTPVIHGKPDTPIYGTGKRIKPRVPGRQDTEHFKSIYLDSLLPLEEYDLIAILLSGGKDSIACYYKLLELGVPKEKIELWHHDIDGGHPSRRMDWRCTQNYVKAFSEAENVPLRLSWRVNGFFGELYRIGTSEPVEWCEPDTGEIIQCKPSKKYLECKAIKESAIDDMEDMILIRGDISRFNYGSMWIALLIMMWFFCPTEDINKLSETESKGDDDMLVLPIKKKWYDMILAGEKTEEYREIKSYYDSRFESVFGCQWLFRGIDGIGNMTPPEKEIIFRNGYSRSSRQAKATCTLTKGTGNPEWGAEPGVKYYVLHIKKIQEVTD